MMRSRTPSFSSTTSSSSSSSSSSSLQRSCSFPCNEPEPPFFPTGVIPFSWEHQPGIPKTNNAAAAAPSPNIGCSLSGGRLPLPPSSSTTTPTKPCNSPKKKKTKKNQRDPFAAAMVRCSKDDDEGHEEGGLSFRVGAKLTRSLSGRLGAIGSCKQSCAVSQAIVRIPPAGRIIEAPTTRFI